MIEIKNLSFGYRKKEKLFTELNLHLPPGYIYGLLGKNGAGKTTLLKIISGLLFPQGGECQALNHKPQNRSPHFLEEIYFIPEEFFTPVITISEYENIYAPFYPRFSSERLSSYISDFDLPVNEKLSSFSYGQKKKFLLAFGVATDCKLLILDEPSNGLDIPSKSQFRRLLASSITDDRTFIVSTHQVRDMENLIDPIIILDDGEIIFNYSVYEVSRCLSIQLQQESPDIDKVLYSEKTLGGYAVITKNTAGSDSQIDLEILFNAVVNNREKISSIFRKGASA